MKLKVEPEGRLGVWSVEKDNLKSFLKGRGLKSCHNFSGSGMPLIGADHSIDSVMSDIDRAERVALLTGDARKRNLNHSLILMINNKLGMFDIGVLMESDLDVHPKWRLFEVHFCSGGVDTIRAYSWEIEVIAGDDYPQLRFQTRVDEVTGVTLKSIEVHRVKSVKEIYR